jgi:hypothetical protein
MADRRFRPPWSVEKQEACFRRSSCCDGRCWWWAMNQDKFLQTIPLAARFCRAQRPASSPRALADAAEFQPNSWPAAFRSRKTSSCSASSRRSKRATFVTGGLGNLAAERRPGSSSKGVC